MRFAAAILGIFVILVVMTSAAVYSGAYNVAASKPANPVIAWLLHAVMVNSGGMARPPRPAAGRRRAWPSRVRALSRALRRVSWRPRTPAVRSGARAQSESARPGGSGRAVVAGAAVLDRQERH